MEKSSSSHTPDISKNINSSIKKPRGALKAGFQTESTGTEKCNKAKEKVPFTRKGDVSLRNKQSVHPPRQILRN
jgi:hypothetical protein